MFPTIDKANMLSQMPSRYGEAGPIHAPPSAAPTLEDIRCVLRDATNGLCNNNQTLRELRERLFGAEPAADHAHGNAEPAGEIGGIMATALIINELLRAQRAIIDRIAAV